MVFAHYNIIYAKNQICLMFIYTKSKPKHEMKQSKLTKLIETFHKRRAWNRNWLLGSCFTAYICIGNQHCHDLRSRVFTTFEPSCLWINWHKALTVILLLPPCASTINILRNDLHLVVSHTHVKKWKLQEFIKCLNWTYIVLLFSDPGNLFKSSKVRSREQEKITLI